jgi:hypothetical protein
MLIKENISCIAEFLDAIHEFDISYTSFIYGLTSRDVKFLYRGISNDEFSLIPAIFRKMYNYDITIDRTIENDRYPKDFGSERDIIKEFITYACSYIDEDPTQDLYKWADFAQHYGVPTRFLDWTENPLVALYFACKDYKPIYKEKDFHGGRDAVVWMIHFTNYNKYAYSKRQQLESNEAEEKRTIGQTINLLIEGKKPVEYPILYKPYYKNQRMSAQSSYFMVWGSKEESFESFFSADNFLKSNKKGAGREYYENQNEIIFKFTIPADRKQLIINELNLCGVNEKSLFPGLEGIGRYLEMKYKFDLEEAKETYL